ncbi:NIPSNAP family protein [Nocardioides carbamazepini]|uniref:NIPSNAP family protein n=1 Tax=Nocardioides carbamazepini TaxID=2854259 RepID=UPI00214A29A8|nr:NIPSNAP family protein [Nocardioides carbamazepini]MCR1784514.1 NIPSNAP family protein [Nocardioides carbamazepini]
MILEEQSYRIQVGKVPALLAAYDERGLAVLRRHLGTLVGCWTSEAGGDMDTMVQVWGFADHDDRARRRRALDADEAWTTFAAEFGHLIVQRRMRLLIPALFSPPFGAP